MLTTSTTRTVLTMLAVLLSACGGGGGAGGGDDGDGSAANTAPVAKAGSDRIVDEGGSVQLDGSASSDADGNALTYQWRQTAGPGVTLGGATAARSSFTAPAVDVATVLAFELTVSDGKASAIDSVSVTVNNVVPGNHPPGANAGGDQAVNEGVDVQLDGSASGDPDGDTLTYQWEQLSGPAVTLSGTTLTRPTFKAPAVDAAATLTFQLTVSDANAAASDAVSVTVHDVPPGNQAPTVDAGSDRTVERTDSLELTATAADGDGSIVAYAWAVPDDFTTGDTDAAMLEIESVPLVTTQQTFTVTVTVTDDRGATATDSVNVTVLAPSETNAPAITVVFPTRMSLTDDPDQTDVLVRVRVEDADSGIAFQQVVAANGVNFPVYHEVPQAAYDHAVRVPIVKGINRIRVEAEDAEGNVAQDEIVVVKETDAFSTIVDIAANPADGMIYAAGENAVWRIEPSTGLRELVTGGSPDVGGGLSMPAYVSAIAVDDTVSPPRLVIADRDDHRLLYVDIGTGARTLLSGSGATAGPDIYRVRDIAIDANRDRVLALATDASSNVGIYAIDPASGARSLVTAAVAREGFAVHGDMLYLGFDASTAVHISRYDLVNGGSPALVGSCPSSSGITGEGKLVFNAASNEVLFGASEDIYHGRIGALDVTTGACRIVSADTAESQGEALGPYIDALVLLGGNVHVAGALTRGSYLDFYVAQVDPASGTRRGITGTRRFAPGPTLLVPAHLDLDSYNGRLYVSSDIENAVYAVELETSERFELSSDVVGSGLWKRTYGIAYNPLDGMLYLSSRSDSVDSSYSLLAVPEPLSNGDRIEISNSDLHNTRHYAISGDWSVDRMFAASGTAELVAYNLSDGTEQVISSTAHGIGSGEEIDVIELLALEPGTHNVLALDSTARRLYRIVSSTGNRSLVSDLANGTQGPTLAGGSALAVYDAGAASVRALVGNGPDRTVVGVNGTDGTRWTVSGLLPDGGTRGVGPMFRNVMRSIVADSRRFFVAASGSVTADPHVIFVVDTETGDRMIVTRGM